LAEAVGAVEDEAEPMAIADTARLRMQREPFSACRRLVIRRQWVPQTPGVVVRTVRTLAPADHVDGVTCPREIAWRVFGVRGEVEADASRHAPESLKGVRVFLGDDF